MYERKNRNNQKQLKIMSLEDLVPQDHMLRDIDQEIDFSFTYDLVKDLYSQEDCGKPGIDPASLFKIVFLQHLFGIRSMRQTIKEIEVNMAYRWFIGYDIREDVPHFSTFGKNYSRRFKDTDVFEQIFMHILQEAIECGWHASIHPLYQLGYMVYCFYKCVYSSVGLISQVHPQTRFLCYC